MKRRNTGLSADSTIDCLGIDLLADLTNKGPGHLWQEVEMEIMFPKASQ